MSVLVFVDVPMMCVAVLSKRRFAIFPFYLCVACRGLIILSLSHEILKY